MVDGTVSGATMMAGPVLRAGEITDAKTVIGLSLALARLG